jgi:hypothetical protein
MKSRSPTLEGFRAVFRQPSLGLAEISWRWSFGFAAVALVGLSLLAYLDTLPVSRGEMVLLRSRQPGLVSQAIAHILRGSGPRAVDAFIVLALGLALTWIVVASCGRIATLKALREYFQSEILEPGTESLEPTESLNQIEKSKGRFRSLAGLNFLRVSTALAAVVGCVGALVFGAAASPDKDPAPGSAVLIFLTLLLLVGLALSSVNWILSMASIFTVAEGKDTFGALTAAVELYRRRTGAVLAAGTWFGLAHVAVFVAATTVVAFPLALAEVLPPAIVLSGVLVVALLYFAVVDFLHVGRLAAYFYIAEGPEPLPAPVAQSAKPPSAGLLPSEEPGIDRDELILSDVPGGLAVG